MNVISLGAGVQSTTMLLMAMHGEIEPMPDCAIFADTGWEPKSVYAHLAWLEAVSTIPIHRVTAGNIREDTLDALETGNGFMTIPAWMWSKKHKREVMGRRQCTKQYKLRPIQIEVQQLNKRRGTTLWLGISWDESFRQKDSRVKYITHRWPLLEMRMTRADCLAWMQRHGYPTPPRSACIGCPMRGSSEWRSLTESEFAEAVDFDHHVRSLPRIKGDAFLHRSLQPLDMVDLRTEQEKGQLDLWGNECEGMCGL